MKSKIHICNNINGLQKTVLPKTGVFVIIDNNLQHLAEYFKEFPTFFLNFNEKGKTLDTVGKIAGWLLENGADRDALVIGAGGGIATDITGFAASIYKRGIKSAFIPTTLLAQVDASIGGKNGVNFYGYKNILGTIRQPEWIFICPQLLATLPENEFKAGIAEVLKTFILYDKQMYHTAVEYFSTVKQENLSGRIYGEAAVSLNLDLLTEIVSKCAEYKMGVVQRDEFEQGERRMLNLGHTFAHAIEKLTEGEISHGFAVSIGIVIAAEVAEHLGAAEKGFAGTLADDFRKTGLPAGLKDCPSAAHLKVADLAEAIKKDKKVAGDRIHFILPKGIQDVEDILLPIEMIKEIANDLR